jgi:hypothetical protein
MTTMPGRFERADWPETPHMAIDWLYHRKG